MRMRKKDRERTNKGRKGQGKERKKSKRKRSGSREYVRQQNKSTQMTISKIGSPLSIWMYLLSQCKNGKYCWFVARLHMCVGVSLYLCVFQALERIETDMERAHTYT